MTTRNQREQVRRHLNSGVSLTPLDAMNLYGIGRLAARIKELRDGQPGVEGMNIVDDRHKLKVRYSVYRLIKKEGPLDLFPREPKGRPE